MANVEFRKVFKVRGYEFGVSIFWDISYEIFTHLKNFEFRKFS